MHTYRLDQLCSAKNESIAVAMAAALPTAGPVRRAQLARFLLASGHAAAAALLVHFESLPAEVRTDIVANLSRLGPALREAGRLRGTDAPLRVVTLIREAHCHRLTDLIADQLQHGDDEVRRQAAGCLRAFAEELVGDAAAPSDPRDLQQLAAAVTQAIEIYHRHQQPAVLAAIALLLPRLGRKAVALLQDARHPASVAMRDLIEARSPALARRLLVLSGIAPFAPAARLWLKAIASGDGLSQGLPQVLEAGHHLLLGPVRQAVNIAAAGLQTISVTASEMATMPASAQRHLPRWIAALPMTPESHARALTGLAGAGDALMRLAALRQLIRLSHRRPSASAPIAGAPAADAIAGAIAAYCHDADACIARTALWRLLGLAWPGLAHLLLELANRSVHASVRLMAADRLAPVAFDRLWNAWPRLTATQRLAAASASIKLGSYFHRQIERRLRDISRMVRQRAMDMIAQLNQGALYEETLIAIARGPDVRLAASAVKALASARSPAGRMVIEASLAHADARVRGNAVEALARDRAAGARGRLRQMAADDCGRPRANAIASLLMLSDSNAASALRRMLGDRKAGDRISALWAAGHVGCVSEAADVAEMAVSDGDAQVRRRAGQTLGQLVKLMQRPLKLDASGTSAGVAMGSESPC